MNRFYVENSLIATRLIEHIETKYDKNSLNLDEGIWVFKDGEVLDEGLSLEDTVITIEGEDVNHIANVLRMKIGE